MNTKEQLLEDLYDLVTSYRFWQKEMCKLEDKGMIGSPFWRKLNALCFQIEKDIDKLLEDIKERRKK